MSKSGSGILEFKIADIVRDEKILLAARKSAIELIEEDPHIQLPKHKAIAQKLADKLKRRGNWSKIS